MRLRATSGGMVGQPATRRCAAPVLQCCACPGAGVERWGEWGVGGCALRKAKAPTWGFKVVAEFGSDV